MCVEFGLCFMVFCKDLCNKHEKYENWCYQSKMDIYNLWWKFLLCNISSFGQLLGWFLMLGAYRWRLPQWFVGLCGRINVSCYFAKQGNVNTEAKGINPGLIVLLVVMGLLLTFLVGNYVLYVYAQKTLPPKKKKPVSKKKLKKERLKQGISAPGE